MGNSVYFGWVYMDQYEQHTGNFYKLFLSLEVTVGEEVDQDLR